MGYAWVIPKPRRFKKIEIRTDATITTHFANWEDARSEINREHKLLDRMVIASSP